MLNKPQEEKLQLCPKCNTMKSFGGDVCARCKAHQPDSMEERFDNLVPPTSVIGLTLRDELLAFILTEKALSRAEGEKNGIIYARECLDAIAFEQDNGAKIELFLNWDDGEKELNKLLTPTNHETDR